MHRFCIRLPHKFTTCHLCALHAETDTGSWVPVVGFDCRGLEPVGFHAENGWKVVSTGGTVFEDVNLGEDWVEYCEKSEVSVGIYNVEGRFVRK
jgi:hypothetical protein